MDEVQTNGLDVGIAKDSYLVAYDAQNISARKLQHDAVAEIESLNSERPSVLLSTRWDLFWNTAGDTGLDAWAENFPGPYWDFMTPGLGDTAITSPTIACASTTESDAPGCFVPDGGDPNSSKEQYVRAVLEEAGWTFLNATSGPFFGTPYEPRLDHAAKEIWYNQQKMDLRCDTWQELVTDYTIRSAIDLNYDGVMFQFVKPQQYKGEDVYTLPLDNSNPSLLPWVELSQSTPALSAQCLTVPPGDFWDPRNNPSDIDDGSSFITFDQEATSAYNWFKGHQEIFYKLNHKTPGILVLDLTYFGIAVWRYSKQIIQEWATVESVTEATASSRFFDAIIDMAYLSNSVIVDLSLQPASSDPAYAVPNWFKTEISNLPETTKIEL